MERVSLHARADGGGYVMRLHLRGAVHAFTAPRRPSPGRVEVILFHTALDGALQQDAPAGPVRGYAVRPDGEHLVLRLDVADDLQAVDVYRDRASDDLLLALSADGPVASTTPTGPPVRQASYTPDAPPPAAASGSAGPASDARERWRLDTIVIDAGHGGKDVGAVGAGGLREKDVTLAVARKVGAYLEDQLGVRVIYTRDDDRFIELKERGRIANEAGGKLFVSIHANAARNRAARGTETYFLGMHKTEAAARAMERENSVIRYEADQSHYERYDDPSLLVRQELAQSAYMRKSEQLAAFVEEQFADRVQRRSRGVKQAGFYVLWSASMPSVLVELGFVTNPDEAAFLGSEAGQTYMASAIFRAIRDFKAQYERDLNLAAD